MGCENVSEYELGRDRTGRHHGELDTGVANFLGQRESERPQAELARRVSRASGNRRAPRQRCHVNDRTATGFTDMWQREARQHDWCLEIYVDRASEILGGQGFDVTTRMESGIVYEHVDPAEFELCLLEQVHAAVGVGHIHGKYLNAALVAQFSSDCFEVLAITRHQHEIGSRFGKQSRRCGANALGATRDDDGLVFENHRGILCDARAI
jgi:hypothetical protein